MRYIGKSAESDGGHRSSAKRGVCQQETVKAVVRRQAAALRRRQGKVGECRFRI